MWTDNIYGSNIVIDGDLNELKYKDLLTKASLFQLAKEPTRKNKILDVLITNIPYLRSKTKVIKSAEQATWWS